MTKARLKYMVTINDKWHDETLTHIINLSATDHATLCGLDGGISEPTQETLPTEKDAKVNCSRCLAMYFNVKQVRLKKDWIDFNSIGELYKIT